LFETLAVHRTEKPSRSALYEALTFSLFLHAAAGLFAIGVTIWEVTFPTTSPKEIVSFVLSTPAPPPPPPPPPRPAQQETITTKVKVPENAFLAPTVIPDTIPEVKPNQLFTSVAFAAPNGVIGGVSDGQDNGVRGGVIGGEDGGAIGGTKDSVGVKVDDGRVHIARDRRLPLTPMSQVYPNYPDDARIRGWEDALVVRYVIGKDGRVKEATVVEKPERDIFVDGTLRAIRSWRFKPLIKDGAPQEVVHELTVYYKLNAS